MIFLLLVLLQISLLVVVEALRMEPIGIRSIWSRLVFQERIGTLLHSINLGRSQSKLTKILLNRRFPSYYVYDVTCKDCLDERRYMEVQRECVLRPQLWTLLASPACLAATKAKYQVTRTYGYFNIYPLSSLLARGDNKINRDNMHTSNLELEKILRLPLFHLDNCDWIKSTARTVDFETETETVWDIWDRFHPRCFLEDDMQDIAQFFLDGINEVSLADDDELARLFVKLANLFFLTDNYSYGEADQVSQEVLRLMQSVIEYLHDIELKPQWVTKVLQYVLPHLGEVKKVGLHTSFPAEELLRAVNGGIAEETKRDHWTIQVALLCFHITGSLHPSFQSRIQAALTNPYLWPLDLLDIYEIEKQSEVIPSHELTQRIKETHAKPTILQRLLMKQYFMEGQFSFFDRLLSSFIPLEMRLSYLTKENAGFILGKPLSEEATWSASLLKVSLQLYHPGMFNMDDYIRIEFRRLRLKGAIELVYLEPATENSYPTVEAVIRLVRWKHMRLLGYLFGLCTLYSKKLPIRIASDRQLLVATGHSDVTISSCNTLVRDFEYDKITDSKKKVKDLAQAVRYCQEAYKTTVQGVRLIESDDLLRLLQPLRR